MRSPGLARYAAGAVAVTVLVAITVLPMLGGVPESRWGSVAGTDDDGWHAAFLLLDELGFEPEPWRARPGVLPRGRRLLWMARAPVDPATAEPGEWANVDGSDPDEAPLGWDPATDPLLEARRGGLSANRYYRGFLEQGGTLVLFADRRTPGFLAQDLGLTEFAELSYAERGDRPRDARLPDGEPLQLDWPGLELELPGDLPREALVESDEGEPLVLEVPVGRGSVVLVGSSAEALTNGRIDEDDNALALVRLAELLRVPDGMLFDEWAIGRGVADSLLDVAFGARGRQLSWHLLLLVLLVAWLHAWAREFPRDPEPLERLSPLARAEAQAGLFRRAGRVDLFAQMLRAGVLRQLGARLPAARFPTAPGSAPLERELVAAVARHVGRDDERARWLELFVQRPVPDLEALTALDRDLRQLERELHDSSSIDPSTASRPQTPRRRSA